MKVYCVWSYDGELEFSNLVGIYSDKERALDVLNDNNSGLFLEKDLWKTNYYMSTENIEVAL